VLTTCRKEKQGEDEGGERRTGRVGFPFIFLDFFKLKYHENRSSKLQTVFIFEILTSRSSTRSIADRFRVIFFCTYQTITTVLDELYFFYVLWGFPVGIFGVFSTTILGVST
jgi:hypothetical protein